MRLVNEREADDPIVAEARRRLVFDDDADSVPLARLLYPMMVRARKIGLRAMGRSELAY